MVEMLNRSIKLPYIIALALGLLVLQAICITYAENNPFREALAVLTFLLPIRILILVLLCWRIRKSVFLRQQWILVFTCFFLWFIAMIWRVLPLPADVAIHWLREPVRYSVLFHTLGYISYILLIALPTGRPYQRLFFWLDTAQVVLISCLIYVEAFFFAFSVHSPIKPIHTPGLVLFYHFANVVTCSAVTLCIFRAVSEDEKLFYRRLSLLSWIWTILYPIYWVLSVPPLHTGYEELLPTAYSILLCIFFQRWPAEKQETVPIPPTAVADFLNIASPAFFTLALLLLGMQAARIKFWFGMGAIFVGFLCYGLRSVFVQNGFEQSQRSLQRAQDMADSEDSMSAGPAPVMASGSGRASGGLLGGSTGAVGGVARGTGSLVGNTSSGIPSTTGNTLHTVATAGAAGANGTGNVATNITGSVTNLRGVSFSSDSSASQSTVLNAQGQNFSLASGTQMTMSVSASNQ
jgi:hypothetical protein